VPAPSLEIIQGRREVGDPVDEDRSIAFEVIGQQDPGRVGCEDDHRDACPHRLDREDQPPPSVVVNSATSAATSRLGV
jgi:hypothetical protein